MTNTNGIHSLVAELKHSDTSYHYYVFHHICLVVSEVKFVGKYNPTIMYYTINLSDGLHKN